MISATLFTSNLFQKSFYIFSLYFLFINCSSLFSAIFQHFVSSGAFWKPPFVTLAYFLCFSGKDLYLFLIQHYLLSISIKSHFIFHLYIFCFFDGFRSFWRLLALAYLFLSTFFWNDLCNTVYLKFVSKAIFLGRFERHPSPFWLTFRVFSRKDVSDSNGSSLRRQIDLQNASRLELHPSIRNRHRITPVMFVLLFIYYSLIFIFNLI